MVDGRGLQLLLKLLLLQLQIQILHIFIKVASIGNGSEWGLIPFFQRGLSDELRNSLVVQRLIIRAVHVY